VLNVVNRHKTQAIEVDIDLEDKQFSGPVAVSEVNGPDIKSENDFGKTTVKTEERTATADQRRLRYSFPAHSFTQLKVRLI
jgi:alpha-N-arabinofuranosidase